MITDAMGIGRKALLSGLLAAVVIGGAVLLQRYRWYSAPTPPQTAVADGPMSDEEWKKILTPQQYHVLREKGTEPPFSSPLDRETRPGTYVSADCGIPLFRSEQKYDSGTGWPSFWAPIEPEVLTLIEDNDIIFEKRVEVLDAKCGGHLGHVFEDGPPPTGKRYCMNGAALRFIPDPEQPEKAK